MTLRVCFLGYEHLGSWMIRGQQVADQRLNWLAATELTEELLNEFEIFCVVKHFKPGWNKILTKRRKIVVLDIVDGWDQPADNIKTKDLRSAQRLFRRRWRESTSATAFIFPTLAMSEDLQSLVPFSSVIYHHFRPDMEINPIRPKVRRIGYEGSPEFLGNWGNTLERYCTDHEIEFSINPRSLASLDIGISVRGNEHDCYLTRRYKSNVKLANFYGSGTPCAIQFGQSAYHETDCGAVPFFTDENSLISTLDFLRQNYEARERIHRSFMRAAHKFHVSRIARQYEQFFEEVVQHAQSAGSTRESSFMRPTEVIRALSSRLWAK